MTTPNTPFNRDLINEIFGQQPELAFLGYLGRSGLDQNDQEFMRTKAGDFLQRLQQSVGTQMARGGLPTMTPQSFFSGLDWGNELYKYSPQERGQDNSRYAPTTRWFM